MLRGMFRMLGIIGWLVAGVWLAPRALAADAGLRASRPEVKKAIVAVIEAQLAEFRKGDAAKAYSYSSIRLRAQRPLRSFTAIVRDSYTEIWTNTGAEFGLSRDDGERAAIPVHVSGAEGSATFDYHLVREKSGWRIAGVLRREPGRGEQL